MLAGMLGLAILIVWLFPDTSLARLLHLYLVELPLRLADKIERRHLILLAIVLCAGQTLALAGSVDLAMAYAIDMSIYYDALIATSTAAAATRFKAAWLAAKLRVVSLFVGTAGLRSRSRKRQVSSTPRRPAANDEDGAGFGFAWAA